MMMEGFIMKKHCKKYGWIFRKYKIVHEEQKIYWDSRKFNKPNYITY
jgi:hypothetical protein